ncbi:MULTISPECIES: hypothetical protein [unclassified Colwellia]|uniref:hypothetical protein n=1 Tax=unclassified Colwellia TaxID=196834 RepID=UPI0015F50336|nr:MULTISPECIES: hypothetical protein [unclassified Colwellia]MBA6346780.1 hypothetical protein [Colwellia sp. BRX8-9]MBA6382951.1 hypothetical protein [Colwellia sp. BRX10-9]MBA6393855.1 hypothetical protein [Colwellia sp. BRX10-6]
MLTNNYDFTCADQYINPIVSRFFRLQNYGNLIDDWHGYPHDHSKKVRREERLPECVALGKLLHLLTQLAIRLKSFPAIRLLPLKERAKNSM